MACVDAVATKAGVDMSDVASNGTSRVGEGTQVRLTVDGKAKWNCFVNDGGEVTSLEQVKGSPAKAASGGTNSIKAAVAACTARAKDQASQDAPSARAIKVGKTKTAKSTDQETRVTGSGTTTQGAGNKSPFKFSCAYDFVDQKVTDFTLNY